MERGKRLYQEDLLKMDGQIVLVTDKTVGDTEKEHTIKLNYDEYSSLERFNALIDGNGCYYDISDEPVGTTDTEVYELIEEAKDIQFTGKEIKIKYFNSEMKTKEEYQIKKIPQGDWIDLRVAEACVVENDEESIKYAIKNRKIHPWSNNFNRIYYGKGQVIVMRLGVAMELPIGYKANVSPRSSTFPSYGLILTNSMGCIDYVYKGDTDEWLAVYYATRSGYITRFDRVCQFEITEQMPELKIITVDVLGGEDRGGHGTTGNK